MNIWSNEFRANLETGLNSASRMRSPEWQQSCFCDRPHCFGTQLVLHLQVFANLPWVQTTCKNGIRWFAGVLKPTRKSFKKLAPGSVSDWEKVQRELTNHDGHLERFDAGAFDSSHPGSSKSLRTVPTEAVGYKRVLCAEKKTGRFSKQPQTQTSLQIKSKFSRGYSERSTQSKPKKLFFLCCLWNKGVCQG